MKYAALLRGIGPGNPNMRNDRLRSVVEELGFTKVQSVISSGNIIFESSRTDIKQMQAELEVAWLEKLGFQSATIIKSQPELQALARLKPFTNLVHRPSSYLLVTFCKQTVQFKATLPYSPAGKTYKVIGVTEDVVFTVTDNTTVKTTDLMAWLEKQFSKGITSRTWKTVEKIIKNSILKIRGHDKSHPFGWLLYNLAPCYFPRA